jgi:hypothetical protein
MLGNLSALSNTVGPANRGIDSPERSRVCKRLQAGQDGARDRLSPSFRYRSWRLSQQL